MCDDQAVVANLQGKGLVVVTGCGHAGVINTVRYARKLTGVDRVHAVLGGFHLGTAAFEPIIPPTVAALCELAPEVVVPGHCTGWRAIHALAAALPDAFIPGSAGSKYVLQADS
jgi:7,8-dihydropterin-6-yl-methyl-4-(beta-D-ribofuranosyl)aminobenzene 5'-phosphate synthase